MNSSLQLLHLSLIQNVGLSAQKKIYQSVIERSLDLYELRISDIVAICGLDIKTATIVIDGLADKQLLEVELSLIEQHQISWATPLSEGYPTLLAHIHIPPVVLYWRGRSVWNESCSLSVVGSRAATEYGKRAVSEILIPCIKRGMIIVSGGAVGIDAMAHETALNHGGKTVVVVGSGLLAGLHPQKHRELFEAVVFSGGALVSCFPLTMGGSSWQFPVRNRIIAGMTQGTFVVQAAQKSGSLITAQHALNEGRNVYALPGAFDDEKSSGCHKLLQQGAQLVISAQDILQDYGIEMSVQNESLKEQVVQESLFTQKITKKVGNALEILFGKKEDLKDHQIQEPIGLLVHCKQPISLEQLSNLTGKAEGELMQELFLLQLEGKLVQDFAGLWCSSLR